MANQKIFIELLEEQKRTAKMIWLIVSIGMPLILLAGIYFLVPASAMDGVVSLAFYGTLAIVFVPLYGYLFWSLRKAYTSVVVDLENPRLETVRSELRKLSRRYDDDSGIDFYIAKFRNGLKCRLKSEVAKKLTIGQEYVIVHFFASKTVFEIKSHDNKTLISDKNILR